MEKSCVSVNYKVKNYPIIQYIYGWLNIFSYDLVLYKWKWLDSHTRVSECPRCVYLALPSAQLDGAGAESAGSGYVDTFPVTAAEAAR